MSDLPNCSMLSVDGSHTDGKRTQTRVQLPVVITPLFAFQAVSSAGNDMESRKLADRAFERFIVENKHMLPSISGASQWASRLSKLEVDALRMYADSSSYAHLVDGLDSLVTPHVLQEDTFLFHGVSNDSFLKHRAGNTKRPVNSTRSFTFGLADNLACTLSLKTAQSFGALTKTVLFLRVPKGTALWPVSAAFVGGCGYSENEVLLPRGIFVTQLGQTSYAPMDSLSTYRLLACEVGTFPLLGAVASDQLDTVEELHSLLSAGPATGQGGK